MKLHRLTRTAGATAAVLALSVSLAACGSDDDSKAADGDSTSSQDGGMTSDAPSTDGNADAGAQTFGPGCSKIPTSGAGSFDGMVKDPVATAASNNPLLSTLVTAVTSIDGLADTLNGAPALTVFAPYNDAFAAIPEKDLNGLVAEGKSKGQDSALYKVLAHHVLGANDDPMAVVGDQETLAGDKLTISGDAESGMTVTDGTVTANVLCGNIPTSNATVYVIDKVLTGVK
ncbi:fasciclin domain-containing protein [Pimelobacter simplex]|uniref:Putative lipoprotein n=1 Tax=Nocardioides simplex TaxID=2045 RepID=A0A0A1DEV2_NOCSI|nr:fasciclin domain-containing protein [Pimelobacter simplex]AIY15719.1 putative lipoprotein [Pimelobacter simplex]MCG8150486.1 fasciclin domain-containing protein [Pimelobacter simplex]GEB16845.1 lipoprotein [Pimelobacter simplex]SFM87770.1 Uncaracterized surface protein containing fasciclin (FAS1) repeats [Pimelobacter simplex]